MCTITQCDNCDTSIEQKDGKVIGLRFGEKGLCHTCFNRLVDELRKYERYKETALLTKFKEEVDAVVKKTGICLGSLLKKINQSV